MITREPHTRAHAIAAAKRKGFTIIQLVIGMLIFAILTGIAFYGVSVYTAQANEARVDSDLSTFEVAIKDYMLNSPSACSDGKLSAVGLNHYLTEENALVVDDTDPDKDELGSEINVAAGVKGEAAYKKLSVLKDPWGHQYRVVIRNNADRIAEDDEYGAKGTDRAFIYVYSIGKDGRGAANDTKQDDSVLCVQYSDGEVYSKIYLPSDGRNHAVAAPAYTYWNKDDSGKHSVMTDSIFALGNVDTTTVPGGDSGSGSGSGGIAGGDPATAPGESIPVGATYTREDGTSLTGDGATVVFPDTPKVGDIYHEGNYLYGYRVEESALRGVLCADSDYGSEWICISTTSFIIMTQNIDPENAPQLDYYGELRSSIAGRPVTHMTGTFINCTALTRAPVVPSTVTCLEGAFRNCSALVNAPVIPKGVTNMNSTFLGCTALEATPIIPNGVVNMRCAFESCTALSTATAIPNTVTNMDSTFSDCTSLKAAPAIPNSVTNMEYAFRKCTSLTTAPDMSNASSVTDMSYAFFDCTSLKTAPTIPSAVTNMAYTFTNCTNLITVPAIPNNVTNMYGTFWSCTSLTTAPDMNNASSVTDMTYAFHGCMSLATAPKIPSSVTKMRDAFSFCTVLDGQTITIPASATDLNGASGTWDSGPSWIKR